jgi:hypothetical protein
MSALIGARMKTIMFTFDINSPRVTSFGIRERVYSEFNYRNRTSFDSNGQDSMVSFQQVFGSTEGNGHCYPVKRNPLVVIILMASDPKYASV